jgi:hypothetical protein
MCCACCWEERGEAGGLAGRSWRVRTEEGALRAVEGGLGVWVEVQR